MPPRLARVDAGGQRAEVEEEILNFRLWILDGREHCAVRTLTISASHLFPRELACRGDQLIGEPVTMVAGLEEMGGNGIDQVKGQAIDLGQGDDWARIADDNHAGVVSSAEMVSSSRRSSASTSSGE